MITPFARLITRLTRRLISRSASLCAMLLVVLCPAPPALAGNPPEVIVTLTNGDRLSGRLVAVTAEQLRIETSYGGRIRIRTAEIKSWQAANDKLRQQLAAFLPALPTEKKSEAEKKAPAPVKNPQVVEAGKARSQPPPAKLEKPTPWQRTIDLAYNFTRGNVNLSDINTAFSLSRKIGSRRMAFSAFGRYGARNGTQVASLVSSVYRYERTVAKVPLFTETSLEIDRIKRLDYRLNESMGLSYPVLKGEKRTLILDFGTGLTREVYSTGLERTKSMSLLRATAAQKLNGKTQLNQQITLFSDLLDPSSYRLQAEASVTTPITKHIALRLAGINRYDHRPQRFVKPNDFSLLTGFSFNF